MNLRKTQKSYKLGSSFVLGRAHSEELKLNKMYFLLGRKYKISLGSKLLIIYTIISNQCCRFTNYSYYGTRLNIKVIQLFQFKVRSSVNNTYPVIFTSLSKNTGCIKNDIRSKYWKNALIGRLLKKKIWKHWKNTLIRRFFEKKTVMKSAE